MGEFDFQKVSKKSFGDPKAIRCIQKVLTMNLNQMAPVTAFFFLQARIHRTRLSHRTYVFQDLKEAWNALDDDGSGELSEDEWFEAVAR